MSTADAAWLRMDRPTNLMIVNSVLWFDEPVDWERCKAVFLERIQKVRKDLGARTRDEADDLQSRLEHASDDALREFGRAAVLAQRSPEALTEMQAEIRARKRMLLV